MRLPLPHPLVIVSTALLLVMPAQAQWKWRDAQGRIQYSDRPPPATVPDTNVLARPSRQPLAATAPLAAKVASDVASAPPVRDPELEARKRQTEAEEQAKTRAEADKLARQRKENCERAREYARTIESGMRIARVNAQGEREILDDAQRAREQVKAREVMASECSP